MRKLTFALLPLLLLAGCGHHPTDDDGNAMTDAYAPNFSIVCQHEHMYYMRDVDTDVMYVFYYAGHGKSLSAYYGADGKPMTYAEFKEIHVAKYHKGE